jgi:hypothetical protein
VKNINIRRNKVEIIHARMQRHLGKKGKGLISSEEAWKVIVLWSNFLDDS